MKKDIYVIKNRINNFVYVGQAINSAERFIAHCKPSSIVSGNSIIDKAIQKYGANNFWFEIIEQQVENYNEREKYWIKELNTIKARIPQQTYRTIIGQMRAGDLGGATVGIERLKKKLAKEDAANENRSRK